MKLNSDLCSSQTVYTTAYPLPPPSPITAQLFLLYSCNVPALQRSRLKSQPLNHDHLLLLLLLFIFPPRLTFTRQVMPLEAAEQRNCLLSRVNFSCACKLLCIDTLSEPGRHTGPGCSPPSGRATGPRLLPLGLRVVRKVREGVAETWISVGIGLGFDSGVGKMSKSRSCKFNSSHLLFELLLEVI